MLPRKKLHNRREPPGMERKILRKMPWLVAGNLVVPVLMMQLARVFLSDPAMADADKYLTGVDIFAIAIGLTVATALLTIAIGCVIVMVMKGPAYVADAYELDDRAEPVPDKARSEF